mgnify:CR=1 FL=1
MTDILDINKCKEMVRTGGRFSYHQCTRKAIEDGFCRQHSPSKTKELHAKWDRESAISDLRCDLADAAARIVSVIVDDPKDASGIQTTRTIYLAVKAKLSEAVQSQSKCQKKPAKK